MGAVTHFVHRFRGRRRAHAPKMGTGPHCLPAAVVKAGNIAPQRHVIIDHVSPAADSGTAGRKGAVAYADTTESCVGGQETVMTASPSASTASRLPRLRTVINPSSWSLYAQVVTVNTAILLGATTLLVVSPLTVSFPVAAEQAIVLAIGAVVIVVANAALLRLSFQGLSDLARKMETVDVLRTSARLPPRGGQETRALIAGYNTMLDGLESERRTSTRRSVSVLEGERRRIGQELHDEIGQRLTGILLQVARVRDDVPDSVSPRLQQIQTEVRATLDEVGILAWQLRPGILDDLGLLRALQALLASLREHTDAQILVDVPARLPRLLPETELALYRIAQEGLTNAIRHAQATTIHLSLGEKQRRLTLQILDDGIGLPHDFVEAAGIRGMRERAFLIQGHLELESQSGQGVRLQLVVQLPDPSIS